MKHESSVHQLIKNLSVPGIRGTDDESDALTSLRKHIEGYARRHLKKHKEYPDWDFEDLVQAVHLKVWENSQGYKGNSSEEAEGWVWAILKNAYYDLSGHRTNKGKAQNRVRFIEVLDWEKNGGKTVRENGSSYIQEHRNRLDFKESGEVEKRRWRDAARNKRKQ